LGHIRIHAYFKEEQEDPYLREQVEDGLDLDDIQKTGAYENAHRYFAEHGRKAKIGEDLGRRPGGHEDDEKLKQETEDIHERALFKKERRKRKAATQISYLGGGPTIPAALRGMRKPRTLENILCDYE
jgi:hypothetical protein